VEKISKQSIEPSGYYRQQSLGVCVIYCHSKVFMVQATRLCNLICGLREWKKISVNRALEESGKKSANRALNQVGIIVNRALEESGKKSANRALNQVGIIVNRALEESGKKSANRAVDVVGIIVNHHHNNTMQTPQLPRDKDRR
jgi:hypothetical protein